ASMLLLALADATNAAAEDDAAAERVLARDLEAAVPDRFLGRHQRELSEAVQSPGRLGVKQLLGGEVLHLAAEMHLERRGVKLLDRADPALAFDQSLPQDRHADAERADRPQARGATAPGPLVAR